MRLKKLILCTALTSVCLGAGATMSGQHPDKATDAQHNADIDSSKKLMGHALEIISATPAQVSAPAGVIVRDDGVIGLEHGKGVLRMQELMRVIQGGQGGTLDATSAQAVASGLKNAEHAANPLNMDLQTIIKTPELSQAWEAKTAQAYVDSVPPRDQALARSVLLGDGTIPGSDGKLYIFVSRSMPMALLRAYSLQALQTGATLVVKGLRRGDTVKDYVLEALEDFNSADGQVMATMEINPNLFDMFKISVVPTVVWTARGGLDDIGSGCVPVPQMMAKTIQTTGPNNSMIEVEKPECMPVDDSAYYKLAGSLKLDYVLERFEKAGAPKATMTTYRQRLAQQHANVHEKVHTSIGNEMPRITQEITIDRLPRHVLEGWKEDLERFNVQRSIYGPAFGSDIEDDPAYREELNKKIRHGLGLSE